MSRIYLCTEQRFPCTIKNLQHYLGTDPMAISIVHSTNMRSRIATLLAMLKCVRFSPPYQRRQPSQSRSGRAVVGALFLALAYARAPQGLCRAPPPALPFLSADTGDATINNMYSIAFYFSLVFSTERVDAIENFPKGPTLSLFGLTPVARYNRDGDCVPSSHLSHSLP